MSFVTLADVFPVVCTRLAASTVYGVERSMWCVITFVAYLVLASASVDTLVSWRAHVRFAVCRVLPHQVPRKRLCPACLGRGGADADMVPCRFCAQPMTQPFHQVPNRPRVLGFCDVGSRRCSVFLRPLFPVHSPLVYPAVS